MKKHNVTETKKRIERKNEELGAKYDSALEIIDMLEVSRDLKTRSHEFACGHVGEVVDELVVRFKFPEGFDLQPHSCFAENAKDFMIEALKDSEISSWIENSDY